jgi:hypothetical protein
MFKIGFKIGSAQTILEVRVSFFFVLDFGNTGVELRALPVIDRHSTTLVTPSETPPFLP